MERTETLAGRARSGRFSPVALAERRGLHYGWVVVAVTFLTVVTAAGVRSAPGVLIRPLEAQFGWSRGEISLALSISMLTYGLAGPISGRLTDRFGLRGMTSGFLVVAAMGVVLTTMLGSLWQLTLYWGVIVGFGAGGVAVVMSATVANIWFEKRRGLVSGVLGGASSAGQLIFLPLLVWITSRFGWQAAVTLLAVLLAGLILPAVALFMRSRPADVGLRPFGATGTATVLSAVPATPIGAAARTLDFWLLAGSFFICGFTTMGLIGTHFIPHATEHGFTEAQAAGILSILGGMNVVGTVTSGYLCDRYPPRKLLALYYCCRALSLLVLPFITTLPMMSLFAVLYGFDYIATVPPTVMLTADRFGRRSVGSIFGWISFAHMVGGAAAAYFAGAIHDASGEYALAIYIAGFLGLLAAAMVFSIRPRRVAQVAAA